MLRSVSNACSRPTRYRRDATRRRWLPRGGRARPRTGTRSPRARRRDDRGGATRADRRRARAGHGRVVRRQRPRRDVVAERPLRCRVRVRGQHLGKTCARFQDYGINIQVVWPGEPNCMYHSEDAQEDMLVLSGECLLLVEGQERRLQAASSICPRTRDTCSSEPGKGRARSSVGLHTKGSGAAPLSGRGNRPRGTAPVWTPGDADPRGGVRQVLAVPARAARGSRPALAVTFASAPPVGRAARSAALGIRQPRAAVPRRARAPPRARRPRPVDSSMSADSTAPSAGERREDVERDLEAVRERGAAEGVRPGVRVDVAAVNVVATVVASGHADRAADLLGRVDQPGGDPASAWRTPVSPPIDIGTNASASPRPLMMNAREQVAEVVAVHREPREPARARPSRARARRAAPAGCRTG